MNALVDEAPVCPKCGGPLAAYPPSAGIDSDLTYLRCLVCRAEFSYRRTSATLRPVDSWDADDEEV